MPFFLRLLFAFSVINTSLCVSAAQAQLADGYAALSILDEQSFVFIGDQPLHARRELPDDAFPVPTDQWRGKAVNVGGSYGLFSGNIFGHVSRQAIRWESVGLGLTWRTPWSGRLTVGADNLITRGKNPFSSNHSAEDEGAIPYVRYEQDL